jgi:hypothetical protein
MKTRTGKLNSEQKLKLKGKDKQADCDFNEKLKKLRDGFLQLPHMKKTSNF